MKKEYRKVLLFFLEGILHEFWEDWEDWEF